MQVLINKKYLQKIYCLIKKRIYFSDNFFYVFEDNYFIKSSYPLDKSAFYINKKQINNIYIKTYKNIDVACYNNKSINIKFNVNFVGNMYLINLTRVEQRNDIHSLLIDNQLSAIFDLDIIDNNYIFKKTQLKFSKDQLIILKNFLDLSKKESMYYDYNDTQLQIRDSINLNILILEAL